MKFPLKLQKTRRWLGTGLAAVVLIGVVGLYVLYPRPDETRVFEVETPSGTRQVHVDCFFPGGRTGDAGNLSAVVLAHGVEGLSDFRVRFGHHANARRIANDTGSAVFLVHYFDSCDYGDLLIRRDDGTLDLPAINKVVYESGDRETWHDVLDASLDWAAKQPEVDDDRMGLVGYSLGGFLSLAVADERCLQLAGVRPRCLVVNFAARFRDWELHGSLCPTQFHHGELDEVIRIEHAERTVSELAGLNVDSTLFTYPGESHVITGDAAEVARARTNRFLGEHLNTPATARLAHAW